MKTITDKLQEYKEYESKAETAFYKYEAASDEQEDVREQLVELCAEKYLPDNMLKDIFPWCADYQVRTWIKYHSLRFIFNAHISDVAEYEFNVFIGIRIEKSIPLLVARISNVGTETISLIDDEAEVRSKIDALVEKMNNEYNACVEGTKKLLNL